MATSGTGWAGRAAEVARLWRTVRHLRPGQVAWRLRAAALRARNLRAGTRGDRWAWRGEEPPSVRADFPPLPDLGAADPAPPGMLARLEGGALQLLDRTLELGLDRPDWRLGERDHDRLWTSTLHEHAWLCALARRAAAPAEAGAAAAGRAARLFRHYASDWIERCAIDRPGTAALAWNGYVVASRAEWWIRSYQQLARTAVFAADREFERRFLGSLWQQSAYLADHLEWDQRGNHLTRDAVGLALAGRLFAGRRPHLWLRRGTRLAVDQAAEQVLSDGGHFERSPKYHLDVMRDVLLVALLTDDGGARDVLVERWRWMAEYLAWLRHPDGGLPLLNDGAVAATGAPGDMLAAGGEWLGVEVDARPRRGGRWFRDTGLVVWHGDPWTLFFDVGAIGPDEQPGHGHADTLSIECSVRGRRLIVDPGTFGYDDDERRRYDRGTEAHNTVAVDGEDSSEVWHVFRCGRRGRPLAVEVEIGDGGLAAGAAHSGYDRLAGRPRHRRELRVEDRAALVIADRVEGGGFHHLQGGLLIDPCWRVEPKAGGWSLSCGGDRVSVEVGSGDSVHRFTEDRPYHPSFGVERRATRLGWRWRGELPIEVLLTLEVSWR